jgi:hypothetical protein
MYKKTIFFYGTVPNIPFNLSLVRAVVIEILINITRLGGIIQVIQSPNLFIIFYIFIYIYFLNLKLPKKY